MTEEERKEHEALVYTLAALDLISMGYSIETLTVEITDD